MHVVCTISTTYIMFETNKAVRLPICPLLGGINSLKGCISPPSVKEEKTFIFLRGMQIVRRTEALHVNTLTEAAEMSVAMVY